MSLHRSPTTILDARSIRQRFAASSNIPGEGLRHSHPSVCLWGQTRMSSGATVRRSRSCMASTTPGATRPLPISGWFVNTITRKPARFSDCTAVVTPGRRRNSASERGAYGLPARTCARFRTPSRSRKTAEDTAAKAGTPYHFVALSCRAGCETKQCQTTAWKASVCGVTSRGSTVGITIT